MDAKNLTQTKPVIVVTPAQSMSANSNENPQTVTSEPSTDSGVSAPAVTFDRHLQVSSTAVDKDAYGKGRKRKGTASGLVPAFLRARDLFSPTTSRPAFDSFLHDAGSGSDRAYDGDDGDDDKAQKDGGGGIYSEEAGKASIACPGWDSGYESGLTVDDDDDDEPLPTPSATRRLSMMASVSDTSDEEQRDVGEKTRKKKKTGMFTRSAVGAASSPNPPPRPEPPVPRPAPPPSNDNNDRLTAPRLRHRDTREDFPSHAAQASPYPLSFEMCPGGLSMFPSEESDLDTVAPARTRALPAVTALPRQPLDIDDLFVSQEARDAWSRSGLGAWSSSSNGNVNFISGGNGDMAGADTQRQLQLYVCLLTDLIHGEVRNITTCVLDVARDLENAKEEVRALRRNVELLEKNTMRSNVNTQRVSLGGAATRGLGVSSCSEYYDNPFHGGAQGHGNSGNAGDDCRPPSPRLGHWNDYDHEASNDREYDEYHRCSPSLSPSLPPPVIARNLAYRVRNSVSFGDVGNDNSNSSNDTGLGLDLPRFIEPHGRRRDSLEDNDELPPPRYSRF